MRLTVVALAALAPYFLESFDYLVDAVGEKTGEHLVTEGLEEADLLIGYYN